MGGAPHRNARSWIALVLGAVSLGTGLAWMLAAGWGVAPLDAFIAGTSALTGFTVGTVIIGVSLVFLVGSWILGSRPGWGTLIAFVGVGAVVDAWNLLVFDFLGWSPATWPMSLRIVFAIRMRLSLSKLEPTSRSFRRPWDIRTSASRWTPTAGCSETTWTPLRPAWMRLRLNECQAQMVPKWFLWPSPSTFRSTPVIAEPPDFAGGSRWSRLGDLNPGPTHYECVALPLS